ncbi:MAG: hypothetical protein ACK53L_23465, partial [Pirellulaceae bacterium]
MGSWTLATANADPTGITLNPVSGQADSNDLWVIDKVDRLVYRYNNMVGALSGTGTVSSSWALNPNNNSPEGIADPPPPNWTPSIRWTGSAGGSWNNSANWTPNRLPTATDNVLIDIPNGEFVIDVPSATTVSVNTLYTTERVRLLTGGSLSLAGPSDIERLTIAGGTLTGAGNVTVSNSFDWTSGSMSGTGTTLIAAGATLDINAIGTRTLNRTLANSGTIVVSADLMLGTNASFVNNTSGIFRINNGANVGISWTYSNTGNPFINAGQLISTANSGVSNLWVTLTNSTPGTVNVDSGVLHINSINNSGTMNVAANAKLAVEGEEDFFGNPLDYTQSGGRTNIAGGEILSYNGIRINGGKLQGFGKLVGYVLNAAEIEIGNAVGVLRVQGGYMQTNTGILKIDWNGAQAGIDYDQLIVLGSVTLGGSLQILQTNTAVVGDTVL